MENNNKNESDDLKKMKKKLTIDNSIQIIIEINGSLTVYLSLVLFKILFSVVYLVSLQWLIEKDINYIKRII